ncbi:MAG: competence/damage-inducible protein A, partial [Synechococcaceae cyanobacterium SM2_3_60]|nr:competence/damage-inducible protein A [Synechococcaceae cyanobacterium SM2_3_60]
VSMVEHPHIWQSIEARFAVRGRVASPNNRKQAYLPAGAAELVNNSGSAPGLIWEPRPGLIVLTFPGVPREMKHMWQTVAVPYLRSRGWGQDQLYSRVLRYWGIPESSLAERVGDRFNATNPTVAPYAGQGEVRLRLTARAQNPDAAAALLEPVVRDLIALAPEHYFGSDEASLASVVGDLLRQRQQTLAVC